MNLLSKPLIRTPALKCVSRMNNYTLRLSQLVMLQKFTLMQVLFCKLNPTRLARAEGCSCCCCCIKLCTTRNKERKKERNKERNKEINKERKKKEIKKEIKK